MTDKKAERLGLNLPYPESWSRIQSRHEMHLHQAAGTIATAMDEMSDDITIAVKKSRVDMDHLHWILNDKNNSSLVEIAKALHRVADALEADK